MIPPGNCTTSDELLGAQGTAASTQLSAAELKLALQLIEQISEQHYQADLFEDEEKQRILAAIDAKIEGREIVAVDHPEDRPAGEVIDLTEMLKASLSRGKGRVAKPKSTDDDAAVVTPLRGAVKAGAKRAPKSSPKTAPATRTRARG